MQLLLPPVAPVCILVNGASRAMVAGITSRYLLHILENATAKNQSF